MLIQSFFGFILIITLLTFFFTNLEVFEEFTEEVTEVGGNTVGSGTAADF